MGAAHGTRRLKAARAVLILVAALVWLWPGQAPVARADSGQVLWFSDLHFDPFFDADLVDDLVANEASAWAGIFAGSSITGPGAWGDETNYPLLTQTLSEMQAASAAPDFVIFTGDFLCHSFADKYVSATGDETVAGLKAFINKTMTFLVGQVSARFPGVPVFPALGNNDSHAGDYQIVAGGSFLADTTDLIKNNFLQTTANRDSFQADYPIGGYYTLIPPSSSDAAILVMNSVFFSTHYPDPGGSGDPAADELTWLEAKLAAYRLAGTRLWVLSHIPAGVDVYKTMHDSANASGVVKQTDLMMKDAPLDGLLATLREYHPEIEVTFLGHTHMDDFRFLPSGPACAPLLGFSLVSPAVSPEFGNNPGFTLLTYDRDAFTLQDYTVHYLDLDSGASGAWAAEYTFSAAYAGASLDSDGMAALYCGLGATSGPGRQHYADYYDVSHPASPLADPRDYRSYWCGMGRAEPRAFADCFNRMPGVFWYLLASGQ